MFEAVAGLVILAVVLLGVIWRPRTLWWPDGMPVFIPAAVGAVLAVVLGLVGLPILVTIVWRVWDASFTLIGLFVLAAALEANHFFEWAALRVAHVAGGSPRRLYVLICLLTIVVTVFLGNDGAILGITAIVVKLVKKTFPKEQRIWWPYIFAAGFLADAFSGFLVPDNLTNIIVASTYHLPFVLFMLQMSLPMILTAVVVIDCFAFRFRSALFNDKISYNAALLENPASVLQDRLIFKVTCGALVVLIVGHLVIGGLFHQPVSFVVVPVALVVLGFVHFRGLRLAHEIVFTAPWEVLVYALGMFVVITAAMTSGVIAMFLSIAPLHGLIAGQKSLTGLFVTGGILAVLSALTNNLPATLAGVLLLGTVQKPAMLAIYAIIIGVDVGPKLTPYGSLATLLWMGILKREGAEISWGRCFKENWPVAVCALVAALLGLQVVGWAW
ncbi:MAG TPA: ArsB/NhaD family transporter [Ktedonobacteraceae bacterium]|nr:ArsB/NhaD family transporter [Ktedonobacteraceae bacterium]